MLVLLQVSNSIGIPTGQYNLGDMKTKGWEFSIGWRDRIGDEFSYFINVNISDNTNELISYNGQTAINPGINPYIQGKPSTQCMVISPMATTRMRRMWPIIPGSALLRYWRYQICGCEWRQE